MFGSFSEYVTETQAFTAPNAFGFLLRELRDFGEESVADGQGWVDLNAELDAISDTISLDVVIWGVTELVEDEDEGSITICATRIKRFTLDADNTHDGISELQAEIVSLFDNGLDGKPVYFHSECKKTCDQVLEWLEDARSLLENTD